MIKLGCQKGEQSGGKGYIILRTSEKAIVLHLRENKPIINVCTDVYIV